MKRVFGLLAVLLLVAGCAARPSGTDGNLVDDWALPGPATYAVPEVGHCYNGGGTVYESVAYTGYQDVPCGQAHSVEVTARRTFTGAAATAGHPPVAGDAAQRAARDTCTAAASDYLGGNWETAFVYVRIGLPSAAEWTGGDRTYTCELGPEDAADEEHLTGSVKGGLTGTRPAARGCVEFGSPDLPNSHGYYDNPDSITATACDKPHNAEFGGVFDAPDGPNPDPADDKAMTPFELRCEALLARYAGQSVSAFLDRNDIDFTWFWPSTEGWTSGERSVDCYIVVPVAHPVTKSFKGS